MVEKLLIILNYPILIPILNNKYLLLFYIVPILPQNKETVFFVINPEELF